jgi:hypothetical protein
VSSACVARCVSRSGRTDTNLTAIYIALLARLPNRAYFPPLSSVDDAALASSVLRMLSYGLLELVSLLLFDVIIRRRLGFSPIVQLVMVLSTQWRPVQAALVFWMVINVQAPLEHYGWSSAPRQST